jgi:hypothetical protein
MIILNIEILMPKYFMSGEKDNTECIATHLGTNILKSLPILLRFVAYRCAIMCEKSFRCTSVCTFCATALISTLNSVLSLKFFI